jgi:amino acid transporter
MGHKQPPRQSSASLGLWDTVSLIVGIIVGVGIFETPGEVFRKVDGPWTALGVWALGGILSLIGALCYAELASAYPRSGGEYIYLTRAYGPGVGFLFAWAQLAVIRTGAGIAALAFIVADAAGQLIDLTTAGLVATAVLAIAVLSLINVLGTLPGKRTQNFLTLAKVAGLGVIVSAGFFLARPAPATTPAPSAGTGSFWGVTISLSAAMIMVMYTYDGWNEATYVAGEVQGWKTTIPRALLLGTGAVTAIYLLVNAGLLLGLGFDAVSGKDAPPPVTALAAAALGPAGAKALNILILISALGAASATIFAGARLYAGFGADHGLFAPLSRWSPVWHSPAGALWFQAAVSILAVLAVGASGYGKTGFSLLVTVSAPVFWFFFLLTGLSLFVLRIVEPAVERPFRVPGYPVTPLLFCGWSAYMLVGSVMYAGVLGLIGLVILAVGLPLYYLSRKLTPRHRSSFLTTTAVIDSAESEAATQRIAG